MDRARAALLIALALAACGEGEATSPVSLLDVPETVAIGVMPEPASRTITVPPPPPPPSTAPTSSSTAPGGGVSAGPIEAPIGDDVAGDRMLMIGDSILAAAAPGGSGIMCDALVLFGWEVAIDAEAGRDVDDAERVLELHLDAEGEPDWDAVAFSFGTGVDGTDESAVAELAAALDALIELVAPRPVLLYTLAETDDGTAAINEAIRARAEIHQRALVVEFADAGSDGVDVVDDTGRTLTEDGVNRLSIRTAAAAGKAPGDADGTCLTA